MGPEQVETRGRKPAWTMEQAEGWAKEWNRGHGTARSHIAKREDLSVGVIGFAIRTVMGARRKPEDGRKHGPDYLERAKKIVEYKAENPDATLADIGEVFGIAISTVQKSMQTVDAAPIKRRSMGIDMREELRVIYSVFREGSADLLGIPDEDFKDLLRDPNAEEGLDLEVQRTYVMARAVLLDVTPNHIALAQQVVSDVRRNAIPEVVAGQSSSQGPAAATMIKANRMRSGA